MKSIKEKIEVMRSYYDRNQIQIRHISQDSSWIDADNISFKWGLADYRIKPQEKKTDWSKVAKDTPVFVRDNENEEWVESYFNIIDIEDYYYTVIEQYNGITNWKFCKLDTKAKSIIAWIPNDGNKPDCDRVLIKNKNGEIYYVFVENNCFEKGNESIVEYAIID